MPATMVLAGLLLAQSVPAITVEGSGESDVGYRELVAHRPTDAILRINANRRVESDDPARLINLGTANARLGDSKAAAKNYRAAIVSRQRYDLELANGTWMDSRAAARLAIKMLARGQALALR